MNIIWLFSFLADSVIALLYFRQNTHTYSKQKLWLKILLLLLLLPLYPNTLLLGFLYPALRVPFRILIYFLLIYFTEDVSLQISAYAAVFWTTVYVIFNNFFFGPYLHDFFLGEIPIMPSQFWSQLLISCSAMAARLIYFGIIAILFPLKGMEGVRLSHIGFIASVCFVAIYTQNTGMASQSAFEDDFSLYYILLHVALILFLLVYEYSRRKSFEYTVMVRQNTASEALLENIRSRQQSEESIRSLRHDLKNHATTLQLLLEQGDTEKAMKYLDTFREEAAAPIGTFHTGNDLLNGILRQKLSPALEQGINVEVSLNFLHGEFIEPFDLCVLMGNVLDNAVEACLKMAPQDGRFIKVSGGPSANCLIVRVENSCGTNIAASNNLPHTTKADKVLHGYGLRNIRRVLNRYNGNLTITTEETARFTATMLIPIP